MSVILITGATGFIGKTLAESLSNEGHEVVGVGFDTHKRPKPTCSHMVYGDIRDFGFCRRIISDYEVEYVYHLASQSIVRICAQDPVNAYDINVMGTVNLLEACRVCNSNIKSVLVSTSDKAYGHAPIPYDETTHLEPKYTYETSKTCQDLISTSFFHNYGVPVKVARCSNVYGPGDYNFSRLIPMSIFKILNNEQPILYSGVGDFVREFIFIHDVVNAFKVIQSVGVPGEAYCVGGTGDYKITELIEKVIELMGFDKGIRVEERDSKFKEIQAQKINSAKLRGLGWAPQWSLEEGLKETIGFYKGLNR